MRIRRLWVAAAALAAVGMAPAGVAQAGPTTDCDPQGGYFIQIYGDLSCADAYAIAAGFDLQGEAFQELGTFTCYTSPADVRPIIFQCADGDIDFAVSQV